MDKTKIEIDDLKGKVITFYSYKGGVGRSMSLVNTGCLMAIQKKKVLLIDWDLEAPGLHTFFEETIKKNDLGLVDLITEVINYIKIEENNTDEKYEEFLDSHLEKYICKIKHVQNENLEIDVLKAGKFDKNYSKKLNNINWINFYKKAPSFFRTFARFLEKKYNYSLIDSRTGLADTSGVCTMLMPQILVLVFALNKQNIDGILEVAKQSVEYRYNSNDSRNISILPLPSRIDKNNSTEFEKWNQIYKKSFQFLFKELFLLDECNLENYFNVAKIPYESSQAYGENIPVLTENINNDFFISYHYARFLKLIENNVAIWDILSDDQFRINQRLANDHMFKGIEYHTIGEYTKAINEFNKSIEFFPLNSAVFNNLGNTYAGIAKKSVEQEKENYILQAVEKYKSAIEIDSFNDFAYSNLGNAFSLLSTLKIGPEKEELLNESLKSHKRALELDTESPANLNNFGNTLFALAKISTADISLKYLEDSIEKYEKAISIDPSYTTAYVNCGLSKHELANLKKDNEKEKYINESIILTEKAIQLNPNDIEALDFLGNYLYELGVIKKGKEKEKLFTQSEAILKEGIKRGNKSYNLSCLYAVWNKKDKAYEKLEEALKNKEISHSHVRNDKDWENLKKDKIFLKLLEKYDSKK
jgi:tetratricopeptide (TPR) repeat protein